MDVSKHATVDNANSVKAEELSEVEEFWNESNSSHSEAEELPVLSGKEEERKATSSPTLKQLEESLLEVELMHKFESPTSSRVNSAKSN